MIELARRAAVALLAAGGRRDGRLPRVAAAAQLRAARLPRVRAARRRRTAARSARCRRAASASCPTSRRARFADATPLDTPRPGRPPPDRGRRPAGLHQDQRLLTVHRRARMDYIGVRRVEPRGGDRRRGAPDRPVHLQGLHGAGRQDAAAAPQAGADPRGRGPDPRLARLQGGRRALRVLPARTSCSRPPPRSCAGWSWACCSSRSTAGSACWCARDLYGRSVSIVVALPRERFNAALRKRLQELFWSGSTAPRSTTTCRSARRSRRSIFFTVHVDAGPQIPEVPYEELEAEVERLARTWDDDLHDALDRAVWARARAAARREVRAAVPRLLQGHRDRLGPHRRRRRCALEELEPKPTGSWSGSATRRSASASRA